MPYRLSSDRVPSGSSRAGAPVAGHGVEKARRVPYRPSPGTATRMVVACRRARRRAWRRGWSSRAVVSVAGHGVPYGPVRAGWPVAGSCAVGPVVGLCIVTSLSDSATSVSLPCPRSGIPKARRLPCPGPTYACSRRRQPLCANIYSFTVSWRFITARSAARLRRGVGPLAARHTVPNRTGSRRDRASPRIIGDNRTSSDIIEQSNITEHHRT